MYNKIDIDFIHENFDRLGICDLPKNVLDEFLSKIKIVRKRRHDIVLDEGEVCKDFAIVKTGLLRMFRYKKGKDISDIFISKGRYCVCVDSFFNKQPSNRVIEVLETAEIYLISHDDLDELCDKYLEFDFFCQRLIACVITGFHWKVGMLQFATAEERLATILRQVPDLMQRVSSVQIASYLGVTPETLSRVRSRVAKLKSE